MIKLNMENEIKSLNDEINVKNYNINILNQKYNNQFKRNKNIMN